jgi:hypothetical protein
MISARGPQRLRVSRLKRSAEGYSRGSGNQDFSHVGGLLDCEAEIRIFS